MKSSLNNMDDYMIKINVAMNYWATGGAENFYRRLAAKLTQYDWTFTTDVDPEADLVIYSNDHKFYLQAKHRNKPTILRITGPRSYSLPQPDDLAAVVCSSARSYVLSVHSNRVLIYNGVDLELIRAIEPIPCQLLTSESRIGSGQHIEDAIRFAQSQGKQLTCLGAKQHVAENTYELLKAKYPQVHWIGLVDPTTALRYIKGCEALVIASPNHGVSNSLIEATVMGKQVYNLGGVETPPLDQLDLNLTAAKYDSLIQSVLSRV